MAIYQPFEEVVKPTEILPLSKFVKEKKGNVPPRSIVKSALKPNKFANWTFVTEHNFKVLVYEDSPMFNDIESFLKQCENEGLALFIKILDAEKAWWTFAIDTDESCDWESTSFGYRSKIRERKKTPRQKTSKSKSRIAPEIPDIPLND